MKTLLVMDSVSRAGGGLLDAERCLHEELCRQGVDFKAYALKDFFTDVDLPSWQSSVPSTFGHRGPVALGVSPDLRRAMMKESADLIYRAGLWRMPSQYAHEWSKRRRKPEIIAPHGMLDPWAVRNSGWKKRIAKFWFEGAHLRDAACIRALCQSEADSIRAYGLKNPVCIIPNGVDLVNAETLNRAERDGQELFATCPTGGPPEGGIKAEKLKGERKILLFLGRIHPKKGLVNALRAWNEIRGRRSEVGGRDEWQFVIAGWDQGGHEAQLAQLCREIGVSAASVSVEEFLGKGGELSVVGCPLSEELDVGAPHSSSSLQMPGSRLEQGATARSSDNGQRTTDNRVSVLFLGPAFGEAKDALLRRADAFILPSFSEGLPMAVLEAWSYRLPVLMTEHCNLPEGFAADAAIRIGTDVESIAEGMRELMSMPVGQELSVVRCPLSEALDVGAKHDPSSPQMHGSRMEQSATARSTDNRQQTTDNNSSTATLASMGANGRALVEERFTWPQVAAQMKEVYEWVLGQGPRPDCVRQF